MCRVAAILHQRLEDLEERDLEELLELHSDSKKLAGELAALRLV